MNGAEATLLVITPSGTRQLNTINGILDITINSHGQLIVLSFYNIIHVVDKKTGQILFDFSLDSITFLILRVTVDNNDNIVIISCEDAHKYTPDDLYLGPIPNDITSRYKRMAISSAGHIAYSNNLYRRVIVVDPPGSSSENSSIMKF